MRTREHSRGFTLIEIMIVVAIIGVLASIAIPNFINFRCKARQTEAQALLKGIWIAEQAYFNDNVVYLCTEDDLRLIGGLDYGETQYNLIDIECADGVFTATMTSRFSGQNGQDVWSIMTGGTLVHQNNGCF